MGTTADITMLATKEIQGAGSVLSIELDAANNAGVFVDFCHIKNFPEIGNQYGEIDVTRLCETFEKFQVGLGKSQELDLQVFDIPADADNDRLFEIGNNAESCKIRITFSSGRQAVVPVQFFGVMMNELSGEETVMYTVKMRTSAKWDFTKVA